MIFSPRTKETIERTAKQMGVTPDELVEMIIISRVAESAAKRDIDGDGNLPYILKDKKGRKLSEDEMYEMFRQYYAFKYSEIRRKLFQVEDADLECERLLEEADRIVNRK